MSAACLTVSIRSQRVRSAITYPMRVPGSTIFEKPLAYNTIPWSSNALSGGGGSPYAATLLGNLKHWLGDEPDIRRLAAALPTIQREIIIRKKL